MAQDKLNEKVKKEIAKFRESGEMSKDFDVRFPSSRMKHDSSPYWSSINDTTVTGKHSMEQSVPGDRVSEPRRANPDSLDETDTPWEPRYNEKQKEKLASIQDSFAVLTDLERRIITLIYTEDLTQQDIAKRLKLSQQRISSALKTARKKIYKIYSGKNASTAQ